MPKAHFDIYRAQVFELAKTMTIKSLATAFTINETLKLMGHQINEEDPRTWKYFMNLAGQYHSLDTVMEVVSLDTLQTIEFTATNLQTHRATRDAYVFGGRYYNELISRYPTQETLILGILNPVDLQTAIDADDGTILYYDPKLVEENETNLIPRLQEWVHGVYARWHVSAYQLTDDLYIPAFLSMLYTFIPTAVMNIRNSNCHTRFAHSFHIREFLASHGKLHVFIDYLTKAQMLWLYRNIRYIHRNAGKQGTMDWLVENILTVRNIPLAEWKMTHNLEDMPEPQLYPKVEFVRSPLNFDRHLAGKDVKSIEEMLDDEQPIARGNRRVQDDAEIEIRRQMETSLRNEYPTKVLESAMLDMKDAFPFTFADFLLNHWLFLSNTNRYNSYINFEDPRTGEHVTMSTKDAFVVFLYAINRKVGVTIPTVPIIEADLVRRIPMPTREMVRAKTEAAYLPDAILEKYYEILPPVGTYISIAGFREDMKRCYDALMQQWFIWSQQEHYRVRGQAEIAGLFFYQDIAVDLAGEQAYTAWFDDRSLDYADYTDLECDLLAETILTKATGSDLYQEISLAELQEALIKLMTRLSSYTVQYLRSINDAPIKILDWNQVRMGDIDGADEDAFSVDVAHIFVQRVLTESNAIIQLGIHDFGANEELYAASHDTVRLPIQMHMKDVHGKHVMYRAPLCDLRVRFIHEEHDSIEVDTPVRTTDEYLPLQYRELDEAFMRPSSPHYILAPSDRLSLQLRWDAYLLDPTIANPMGENLTIVTMDGMTDTPLSNLHITAMDGFLLE